MTYSQAIIKCFQKYAVFSGRASRKEYWSFIIFTALVGRIAIYSSLAGSGGWIGELTALAMVEMIFIIPTLAVGFRRMQDVGKPGYYCLIPIYAYVLASQPGLPHANEHGEPVA